MRHNDGDPDGCARAVALLVMWHDSYVACSAAAGMMMKIIVQVQVGSTTMRATPLSYYLPRSLQRSAAKSKVVAKA